MKLWMILTPKGNPASHYGKTACASKTRKDCISAWSSETSYGGTTEAEVWADWEKLGYTCKRVEVRPC